MSCWTGTINYPELTPEQNQYLENIRDGFTANGCALTQEQEDYLAALRVQLATLVLDIGVTDTLELNTGFGALSTLEFKLA